MVVQDGTAWRRLVAVDQFLVIHITVVKHTQSVSSTGKMPNKIWGHQTPSLGNDYLFIDSESVRERYDESTKLTKVRRSEKVESTTKQVPKKAAMICHSEAVIQRKCIGGVQIALSIVLLSGISRCRGVGLVAYGCQTGCLVYTSCNHMHCSEQINN
jgi:hypothetical protein